MHRRVRVRVRVRARVRARVRVRAACDASHLLGRPDLGGCVVVVDGHILLLPGVLYLVRARARVRVKVRPRQGWSESVGVSLLVCVHLRVAMQPQVRPVLPHEANHHLEAAR